MNKIIFPWLLILFSTSTNASNNILISEIQTIIKTPILAKDELETTSEYKARVKAIYDRYAGKTYKLVLNINGRYPNGEKIASYDADSQKIRISMPSLDSHLFWNKNEKIRFLYYSYIPLSTGKARHEKYIASNKLGNQTEVESTSTDSLGVAILGRSNPNLNGQSFTNYLSREKIRKVLDGGKVVLTLRTDIQSLNNQPSIIIIDTEQRLPTMQQPIEIKHNRHMLPVRLISITLQDEIGKEIFTKQGTEQNTSAIEKMN